LSDKGRHKAEALADYAVACMEFKDKFTLSEKSVKYFLSAIKNDPDGEIPLKILTTYWNRKSEKEELLKQLLPIAEEHPEAVNLNLAVVKFLISTKQNEKAISLLKRSLSEVGLSGAGKVSGEARAGIILKLVQLYAEKKDWDSGEELLDQVLDTDGLKKLLTVRLAATLFYAACADQGPDGFFAGWSKRRYRRKLEENLNVLEKLCAGESIKAMSIFPVLEVYQRYSMNERAENFILSQLLLNPSDTQLFILLAKVFEDNKKYADAFRAWKLIVNSPRYARLKKIWKTVAMQLNISSDLYFQLGYAALNCGNWNEAVKAFDWGLLNNPEDANTLFQLGFAYLKLGKFKKAIYKFEKVSDVAQSGYFIAYCYRQLGEYQKSFDAMKRAEILALKEKDKSFLNKDFYMEYIYIADRAGKYEESEKAALKLLKESPDDPTLNNFLGYQWADRNKNLDRAEEMIQKALDSDDSNEAFLDSMAWVLYRKKEYQRAREYIEEALSAAGPILPDAVIRDHAGDIYSALGKKKQAVKQWRLALETYSDEIDTAKLEEKISSNKR
jgi:tetratricopeptide (TPR) repeat protein